jgi:hypothetical protein
MANYKFRVRQGCAIILPDHSVLQGGEIATGRLPDSILAVHHRNGFVEPINLNEGPQETKPLTDPSAPGQETKAPVPASIDTAKGQGVTTSDPTGRPYQEDFDKVIKEPTKEEVEAIKRVRQHKSPWVVNPELLGGKDLMQLNVMIAERDPTVKPFDTEAEAKAFLSADYEEL